MAKIAFVFAGQGSQTVGMGKDLCERFDKIKELFSTAEAKLPGITNIMHCGPKEKLDITINTQPAMFLADLACAMAIEEKGIKAKGTAGFSLGEVPAACYAGLMSAGRAFDFVCFRAKAMQECSEKNSGTMFAVLKLEAGQVEEICKSIESCYPVNYNCPGQTVVACRTSAADKLSEAITNAGGRALKLAVSGAFHSPLMNSAGENIEKYLENEAFGEMKIPIYANITAEIYDDPKKLLAKQVNHPVLWQKTIENMIRDGFDTFIEAGPGKTLTGLIKKINPDVRVCNVSDAETLEELHV